MLTNINWAVKIVNNGFQASLAPTCGHCKKCRNNICVCKLGLCQAHFHFSAFSTENGIANIIAEGHFIAIHWYQNSNFLKCRLLSLSTCQFIFLVADVFVNLRSTWRLVIANPTKNKNSYPSIFFSRLTARVGNGYSEFHLCNIIWNMQVEC